jgi:guanylate kinase
VKKEKVIIFSAPSGAGKTTLVHHVLKVSNLKLKFSVSAASRDMRPNEEDGVDYHFLSVDEFKSRIENNDFIEWEQVYKNQYYGTLKSEVEQIWAQGFNAIFDVDVIGGINLKKHFGEKALSIFVQPPNIEALENRLRGRSTEDESSLKKRLDKSEEEMSQALKFDVVLVNDNLEIAKKEAETLIVNHIS